jgi:hypothetical protein
VLVRALVLALVLVPSIVVPARADIGVAMDTGKIMVTQRLAKGGTYQLPSIGVLNPGSETSTYAMGVGFIQGQPDRPAPANWFTFSPSQFTLAPGATQPVRITLDIPTDAQADDYAALLQAQIAPAGEGAQIGAAAATQLAFTVEPSTLLEAWLLRGRTVIERWSPWSYLLPAFVVLAAGGSWLRRRFRVGLRIERR